MRLRNNRVKKTISSDDTSSNATDDERVPLPLYLKIPHIKKDACDTKMNNDKSKQQLTSSNCNNK